MERGLARGTRERDDRMREIEDGKIWKCVKMSGAVIDQELRIARVQEKLP